MLRKDFKERIIAIEEGCTCSYSTCGFRKICLFCEIKEDKNKENPIIVRRNCLMK